MSRTDDEYAALHSYIQLVESEINQVIAGGRPSSQTSDGKTTSSAAIQATAGLPPQDKQRKKSGRKSSSSSKKSSRRSQERPISKGEEFERRKAAICFGIGATGKVLDDSNVLLAKDAEARRRCRPTEEASGDTAADEWPVGEQSDSIPKEMTESTDELLERILNNEARKSWTSEDELRAHKDISNGVGEPNVGNNGPINNDKNIYLTPSPRTNKRMEFSADLHKLIDSDRNILLLGPPINAEKKNKQGSIDNGSALVDERTHRVKSSKQSQDLYEPKHDKTRYADYRHQRQFYHPWEPQMYRGDLPYPPDPNRHRSADGSRPDKDPLDELRKKKRAELLSQIYEDVKRVTRPLPSQGSPSEKALMASNVPERPQDLPGLIRPRGYSDSDAPLEHNSLRRHRKASGPETSVLDPFDNDGVSGRHGPRTRGDYTRKSYPSADNIILSPPPGFGGHSSDEDSRMDWKLVSFNQNEDGQWLDIADWTPELDFANISPEIQYYAVPFELEATPSSNYKFPSSNEDVLFLTQIPTLSEDNAGYWANGMSSAVENAVAMREYDNTLISGTDEQDVNVSLDLAGPWITPQESDNEVHDNHVTSTLDLPSDDQHDKGIKSQGSMTLCNTKADISSLTQTGKEGRPRRRRFYSPSNSRGTNREDKAPENGYAQHKPSVGKSLYETPKDDDIQKTNGVSADNQEHTTHHDTSQSQSSKERTGIGVDNPGFNSSDSDRDFELEALLHSLEDSNDVSSKLSSAATKSELRDSWSYNSNNNNSNNNNNNGSNENSKNNINNNSSISENSSSSMCQERDCKHDGQGTQPKDTQTSPPPHLRKTENPYCQIMVVSNDRSPRQQSREHSQPESVHNSGVGGSRVKSKTSISSVKSTDTNVDNSANTSKNEDKGRKLAANKHQETSAQDASARSSMAQDRDDHSVKKTKLKDTAIQTSLEIEGYTVDISDSVASQSGTVRRCSEDRLVKPEGSEECSMNQDKEGNIHGSSSDSLQDNMCNKSNNTSDTNTAQIEDDTEKYPDSAAEMRKNTGRSEKRKFRSQANSSRTTYLRSKSLHGGEEMEGKNLKPEAPSLSGSLRELSHLNIDVSQRLVDGERRFVVANGSPEMQVMVNALTPVLTRRSRGRNARKLGQQDQTTELGVTAAENNDENVPVEECSGDKFKRQTSPSVHDGNANALPLYARLRSHEGSYHNKGSGDPNSPKEILNNKKKKQIYQISEKFTKMSRAASEGDTSGTSPQQKGENRQNGTALRTGLHLDLAVNDDELSEELEKSKKSLFLSPKLAHTWHGASDSFTHRPAPRMGIGMMFGDATRFIYVPDGNGNLRPAAISPNFLTSSSSSSSSSPHYHQHAQTLPVISRTLLDAMHKRYCAHQYSNQYQTLQPFSILRLDPASSSRNQPITALRVEPRQARDHEVHAAPPSPQFMARLRKLHSDGESDTGSSATDSVQSSPRQQHHLEQSPRPSRHAQSIQEADTEQNGEVQNLESPASSRHGQHLDVRPKTVSPESSPNLRERLNHGHRHQAELEAVEALKWLRAAGFPQYAQMFEDGQFPVDLSVVERDHDFLDKDSLKSLFRRLETLNKYAGMKIDSHSRKKAAGEEEDDDDLCALSERWEYQKSVRRWSRKDLNSPPAVSSSEDQDPLGIRSGSHDSLLADQDSGSQTGDSPLLDSKMPHQGSNAPGGVVVQRQPSGDNNDKNASQQGQGQQPISPRLRRVASERIKTAKNLFKKMEGLKSKKSRRHPNQRNIVEISGPVVADRENMQAKLQRLNCVDISPTSETLPGPPMAGVRASDRGPSVDRVDGQRTSPEAPLSPTSPQPSSYPTSPRLASESRSSDASSDSASQSAPESALRSRFAGTSQSLRARPTGSSVGETRNTQSIHDSTLNEYYSAQSSLLQNLQSAQPGGAGVVKKNNSDTNLMEIFLLPQDHQPGSFPRLLQNGYIETEACGTAVNSRTGSVRLGRDTGMPADHYRFNRRANELSQPSRVGGNRVSVYDNFLPSDGRKPVEGGGVRSVIPGIIELGPPKGIQKSDSGDSSTIGSDARGSLSVDMKSDRNTPVSHESDQTDTARTSRESSAQRTDDQESVSIRDRSVSFESSSSRTGHEGTPVSEREFPSCGDSRTSQNSSSDSSSLHSRKVTHSASVDSYFRDSSGGGTTISSSSDNNTSSSTLQQEYDEFDVILRQLYENIDDLTRFMSRDKEAEQPKMVHVSSAPNPSIATSTNTNSNKTQAPLHVVAPSTLPVSPKSQQQPAFELYSPTSPTSDLVLSPASPLSPDGADESMDLDGVTELDNNSWSGGEGSNTAESGSEDQDVPLTDLSHDDSLDQIPEVSRERRDSGVGHSLTRAPSERRRKKIRWHSFQRCHRPDVNSRAMQINSLTVGQLVRLQKLSLLKLTGIMEKCLPVNKSGWNWMMPRFMKRHKAPDFSERNVFGVPLSVMAQRTGQPLPQCVLYAMRYLRRTSQNAVGIFRKSGVKSKIQQLRDHLEAHPDTTDFEGINAYNVADMLKTYFRDLPECLLTTKMSETFRSIYTHVPQSQRLEAIQAAILLLPDENREVLQSILLFLSDISTHEADHQMNASNLAVCFTPTVFQLGSRQTASNSPKRSRKNSPGIPDPREIMEQKAAHECLLMMITECKKLFTVPANQFRQLQVQSLAHLEPAPLQDIGNSPSEVRAFGQERIQMVLKEAHDKNRGWVQAMTVNDVEIFHRKPMDNCPLKEWKMVVDIEAPPIEVLRRIMHERHAWDEDLLSWSVVERLDPYSDIFQFVLNSMAPHPSRHYCVLRYWRSDLNKGACALITMSVEHTDAMEVQGVWAADLGSYFLMEPCGSGRARVTYITRVDTRGRTPEWYTKIFGHLCANFLERLKESFKQDASGPETKV